MMKRLFVAGLAAGLSMGLALPARAQTTAAPETRVNVIEPALDLDIAETALSFGQGTPGTTLLGGGNLTVTFSDAATDEQDTTGWSVYCAATPLSRSGGGGTIAQANIAGSRTGLSFTPSTGPSGAASGATPVVGTTQGMTALSGNLYLFKSGGSQASTSSGGTGGVGGTIRSRGTWTTTIPGLNFQVTIPGGQATGSYTGTLTMTIVRGIQY